MDSPFLGVIFSHAGSFAPAGWTLCQGQLIAISQNDALFALLGTTFGGDGVNTFGLPDLRGRLPVGQGQGPGLSNYVMGQIAGTESVTINTLQMPSHTHNVSVVNAAGNAANPGSTTVLAGSGTVNFYDAGTSTPNTTLLPTTVGMAGGNIPFEIVQPILTTNYIIALNGIFPSRN